MLIQHNRNILKSKPNITITLKIDNYFIKKYTFAHQFIESNKSNCTHIMNIYLQIFTSFAKIGAFTFGGGYAMIPIIQKSLVEKKKWIDEQDFLDVVAISQSAPGILAVNISIFLGYRLKGVKGSIVATLGSILPSFLMILIIAMFFSSYQHNPTVIKIFSGIRPVVVALIAAPVIGMAKKSKLNLYTGALAAITALLIIFLKVSPTYILLVVLVLFLLNTIKDNEKAKKGGKE